MRGVSFIQLNRRWRLRCPDQAAYWGIYDFIPSDENEAFPVGFGLHPLAELLSRPCLLLFGRPGSGKTAEFRMNLSPKLLPLETVIALEARHLDGSGAASIFSGARWQEALAGGKPIRLVLDSVDEALLGRGTFLDGLIYQLGLAKAATEKASLPFSLVLTGRPTWSDEKAEEIADLWGVSAQDCTFELAPLTLDAALTLAESKGVKDRGEFAKAVALADMQDSACWPRTLIWLATEYARDGAISSTLTALHAKRCSWQFEEELLEMLDVDEPELAGADARHRGGSQAGLKHSDLADAVPLPQRIEVHLASRGLGADVEGAADHDVEIGVGFPFPDDDLVRGSRGPVAVGGELLAGFVIHKGEDPDAGQDKRGHGN